jgi:hypothetical protein
VSGIQSRSRGFLALVATLLTSVAILITLLAHYANVVSSSATFSNRAVQLVHTGAVRSLIVDNIANRLLGEVGNQASLQPVITEAVSEAMDNQRISDEVSAAASSLHNQLVSGHANALSLTLPDIGPAIAAVVQSRSPQLAAEVSRVGSITVVDVPIPSSASSAIHDLAQVGRDASLLIILSAALAALALLLSTDRRRTIAGLGLGAVVAGLIAAAAYIGGRGVVVNEFSAPAAQTAARAAWSIYLGGLETSGLVVAAVGALVAVSATVLGRGQGRSRGQRQTDWGRA